jgi:hypothetical protein
MIGEAPAIMQEMRIAGSMLEAVRSESARYNGRVRQYIRRVQPAAECVEVACTTGVGLDTRRQSIDAKAGAC